MYVCMYSCIHVCMYVCICACIYIYIHICIYVFIHVCICLSRRGMHGIYTCMCLCICGYIQFSMTNTYESLSFFLFHNIISLMGPCFSVTTPSHKFKHCNTLHRATYCNPLHRATYCNTLQHTATYGVFSLTPNKISQMNAPTFYTSLTATHCNTLQHTATHCNAL